MAANRTDNTNDGPLPTAAKPITLSAPDREALWSVLIDPPEPPERLARAFADHARRVAR